MSVTENVQTDTASQSPAPLSDRIVSHMLAEFFPFLHNSLTQLIDILVFLFTKNNNMSIDNSHSGLKSFNRWIFVTTFSVTEQHLAEIQEKS